MKKIIALAVAAAVSAPIMAAEVTISGDVEYILKQVQGDGISATQDGDADIQVTATQELSNGMTVTLKQRIEDLANSSGTDNGISELALTGAFGGLVIGGANANATDSALTLFDEASHVAEDGGAQSVNAAVTGDLTLRYDLPVLADGLKLAVSATVENGSVANTNDEKMHTAYAVQYAVGGATIHYASANIDGDTLSPKQMGVTMNFGPVFIGAEFANDDVTAGTDTRTVGLTYNYGPGKFYVENGNTTTASTDVSTMIYGVSYKLGGAVNLYAQNLDSDTNTDDATAIGVEYSF